MKDGRNAAHWSAYVFGEIGSQELDDFGETIRSPHVTPAEVRLLVEAMAERARSYFGGGDNGELAALGMLDGADVELASLQHERTRRARRGAVRSAGAAEDATTATVLGA